MRGVILRPALATFTTSGDATIEGLIRAQLDGIRDDVLARLPEAQLDCLVLGGGYGRGEGGVLETPDGPRPYNDYDIVLVHRMRDEARLRQALAEVHRVQSARCGIHVDVLPLRRDRLARLPPALTWYELAQGHAVLWGDAGALSPLLGRALAGVDQTEWGRLLVNRGSGLLFASWLRRGFRGAVVDGDDESAFTTRQVFKAWLSLGDVLLADRGQYSPSVRQRLARFDALCEQGAGPDWQAHYRAAVDFKLRPQLCIDGDARGASLTRLCDLYPGALAQHPCAPASALRGLHATLRYIPPGVWAKSWPLRHPRERLRHALIAELRGQARLRRRLVGDERAYETLWAQVG